LAITGSMTGIADRSAFLDQVAAERG